MKIKDIVESYHDYDDDRADMARDAANDATADEFREWTKEYLESGGDHVSLEDVLIDEIGDDEGAFWSDPALKDLGDDPRYLRKDELREFIAMFSTDPASAIKRFSISIEEYTSDYDNQKEWAEAEWEQKNPYASRGLSRSDFY